MCEILCVAYFLLTLQSIGILAMSDDNGDKRVWNMLS